MNKNFENHIATFKDFGDVQILDWRNPKSCLYGITYMIMGNNLFVTGDCYNAIYSWCEKIDFEFLANLDLVYFFGNINHLANGRRFSTEWSSVKALSEFKHYISENFGDDSEERKAELWAMARQCSKSSCSWNQFIDNTIELSGEEYLVSAGEDIPVEVKLHYVGLRLALHQLCKTLGSGWKHLDVIADPFYIYNIVYVVQMFRWGDTDDHSYVLGVYFSRECAEREAVKAFENRGLGKYLPAIYPATIDGSVEHGDIWTEAECREVLKKIRKKVEANNE